MKWIKYKINIIAFIVLILIPIWIYFIIPEILEIPSDLNISTQVNSYDNFYDQKSSSYQGEQRSITTFSYKAKSKPKNGISIIENIFDVRTLEGEKIFSVVREYGIDEHTGMHVSGYGDHERNGYLFAPRMKGFVNEVTDKNGFDYWHVNYDVPAHMEYRSSENIYGLNVYKYEANFVADQTKELKGVLPGVGIDKGITLNVNLKLWVEPYTGRIVQYTDNTEAFYYDLSSGQKLYPWNKFHNNTSVDSATAQAKEIGIIKTEIFVYQYGVTSALFLLALLLLSYPIIRSFFVIGNKDKKVTKNNIIFPLIAGGALMVSTIGLVIIFYNLSSQQIRADFIADAARINAVIDKRLQTNADILRGAQGLFNASNSVERDEWKAYVKSLNLQTNYPAVLGFGFGKLIDRKDKNNFISSVKKEGFPEFTILPIGDRDEYVSVLYLEPFDGVNRNVFGYDMFSESLRKTAMTTARDTGDISMTGKIFLAQDAESEPKPAFIIYGPVFKPDPYYTTIKDRKDHIFGYVYAAIRMNNLMVSILSQNPTDLGIEIYDGGDIDMLTNDRLMYKNDKVSSTASLSEITNIYFQGHKWTIRYSAPSSFGKDFIRSAIPIGILVVGFIMSSLLSIVLYIVNTRREKAELLAMEITKDLNKETNKLDLATKSARIGVWEWDVVKNVLVWDEQMYALYGIKKENFGGAYDAWQSGLHPDDKKLGDDAIQLALKGKKDFNIDFRIVLPSGEIKYIRAYAIVERDEKNNPIRMIGVNFDITREKEVDRAKTEFVSLASHQLKTPIGSILWDLEMLIAGDYGSVTSKQKDVLNEAYTMSRRMNDLVNALLNISRIEMGVFIIEPRPTDFIDLCNEVIMEMNPRLLQKGHELIKDFDSGLPQIPADDKLLRIIFQNFISNAIKYTLNKGKIKVSIKLNDKQVIFSVANNGEPIPYSEHEKIFSKLFRASNAQSQDPDGNGLGLYVVKQIVENAGGKVWFTSKSGEDTVFACSFPISGMTAKSGIKLLT